MTITDTNGQTIQAALVTRSEDRIRVAIQGSDDVTEYTQIHGTWVSEDLEPVHIAFGPSAAAPVDYQEEDFVCSKRLAAHLIHLMLNPEEEDDLNAAPPLRSLDSNASQSVM